MTIVLMLSQSLGFQGMFKTKRNVEENEDNMASRLQIEMGKAFRTAKGFLRPVFQIARRGAVVRGPRTLSTFFEVSLLAIGYNSRWR
jgi:hypothetical protein